MSNSCNLCSQRNNRDLRLLRSCLHAQVFAPFRYALHIGTWRISVQDAVVFGKIIPFLRVVWIFHIQLIRIILSSCQTLSQKPIKSIKVFWVVTFVLDCIFGDDHWHPKEACKQAEEWREAFHLPSNAETSLGGLSWGENEMVCLINEGTQSCTAALWPQLAVSSAALC